MRWMLIGLGLLAAISAIGLIGLCSKGKKKHGKGETSIVATVKRVMMEGTQASLVIFVFQGREMRFALPQEIARQLQPGERGILTFQGERFVYFVSRQDLLTEQTEDQLSWVS